MIKDSDKAYLLSLKPEDLTFSTLVGLFGDTITCGDDIKSEVLAVSISAGNLKGFEKDWNINGESVKLAVEKQ